ncbi:MAG TPA: hypothetical protein VK155_19550 [Bacteroidales bacterium]|jgi:ssDNA-binding Zn-finger/Zn-ribbon topoisomerase 1|nr:hypothetical protein [Bacteroidales bacterium]
MKNLVKLFSFIIPASLILSSCEGPMGLSGKDANESCKECHNSKVVEQKSTEWEFSKHAFGEAAFEEAGNTGCTPCHASEAFKYVSQNNIPATFTLNATTGKYSNDYATTASHALGEFNCFMCHDSLHTSYTFDDFYPLTTTAPVAMTMWKGTKTIDLTQDGGKSNLCVKCHQPRPLTKSSTLSNGDIVDYTAMAANPTTVFYSSTVGNAAPNTVIPSYRTHVHYGTAGAVFAGKGGVEFQGSLAYTNSAHTSKASCEDCHMAEVSGRTGGHTFYAKDNFNGCNVAGCHSTPITSASTTLWKTPRAEIKTLLDALAAKINAAGGTTPILHSEADPEANLWAGKTTGNYDGYLNIYDPSSNAAGVWKNPAPSNSWTQAQKDANNALPVFPSLTNAQMGAMINFQMALRDFSMGIHNFNYTKALLQNSIEKL